MKAIYGLIVFFVALSKPASAREWPMPQKLGNFHVWQDLSLPVIDLWLSLSPNESWSASEKAALEVVVSRLNELKIENSKSVQRGVSFSEKEGAISISFHALSNHQLELLSGAKSALSELASFKLTTEEMVAQVLRLQKKRDHALLSPQTLGHLAMRQLIGLPPSLRRKELQSLTPASIEAAAKKLAGTSQVQGYAFGAWSDEVLAQKSWHEIIESKSASPRKNASKVLLRDEKMRAPRIALVASPLPVVQAHLKLGIKWPSSHFSKDGRLKSKVRRAWVNQWLAGAPNSPLQRIVRERMPLTYGLMAQIDETDSGALWTATTSTRVDFVGALTRVLLSSLQEVAKMKVGATDLERVGTLLRSVHRNAHLSFGSIASRWLIEGEDVFDPWLKEVESLTTEALNQEIVTLFEGRSPLIVVVGDLTKTKASLLKEKLKPSETLDPSEL